MLAIGHQRVEVSSLELLVARVAVIDEDAKPALHVDSQVSDELQSRQVHLDALALGGSHAVGVDVGIYFRSWRLKTLDQRASLNIDVELALAGDDLYRHGVEQFVGKNDGIVRRPAKVIGPRIYLQLPPLDPIAKLLFQLRAKPIRRFDQSNVHRMREIREFCGAPVQEI